MPPIKKTDSVVSAAVDVAVVADVVRVSLIWKGPLVTVAIRKKFSPRKKPELLR